MEITRTSVVSGLTTTRDLPITEAQLKVWQDGALVQDAFPHLSLEDREFFLTGITESEWRHLISEGADDA